MSFEPDFSGFTQAFNGTSIVGSQLILPGIVILITLVFITRNVNEWKRLAFPMTLSLAITGMRINAIVILATGMVWFFGIGGRETTEGILKFNKKHEERRHTETRQAYIRKAETGLMQRNLPIDSASKALYAQDKADRRAALERKRRDRQQTKFITVKEKADELERNRRTQVAIMLNKKRSEDFRKSPANMYKKELLAGRLLTEAEVRYNEQDLPAVRAILGKAKQMKLDMRKFSNIKNMMLNTGNAQREFIKRTKAEERKRKGKRGLDNIINVYDR